MYWGIPEGEATSAATQGTVSRHLMILEGFVRSRRGRGVAGILGIGVSLAKAQRVAV